MQGDDSVVACILKSEKTAVETHYTPSKDLAILESENPTIGITNPRVNIVDGFFNCSFSRKKTVPGYEFYYDLSNQEYYLLAAFGEMYLDCKKKCLFA